MKTKLITNKFFIVIILIFLLFYLITLNLFNKYTTNIEKFDSYKEIKDKLLSKKALESFLTNQKMKGDFEYTKKIIMPLIADKKEYKQGSAISIASKITGEYKYTLSLIYLSNDIAYYSMEISFGPPSKGETDFILKHGFKMIKNKDEWFVQKICVICYITEV